MVRQWETNRIYIYIHRERKRRVDTEQGSRVLSRVFDYVWLRTRVVTPRTNQSIIVPSCTGRTYSSFFILTPFIPCHSLFPTCELYSDYNAGQLRRWGRQLNSRHRPCRQRPCELNFQFTYERQKLIFSLQINCRNILLSKPLLERFDPCVIIVIN